MNTLLLATRNAHKIAEIRAILGAGFSYLSLKDFSNAPEVTEDANTFAGNATKKAVTLANWIAETRAAPGLFVLADDSGLEVDALNGAPGVHSARFAATNRAENSNSADAENSAKLMKLLDDVPRGKRTARFRCVLALTPVLEQAKKSTSPVCWSDELELVTQIFEGSCEGSIGFEPRGQGGFGYDPLFIPSGYEQTFAELGEDLKNRLSHRARALAALKSAIYPER